jgi:hypothetical protein
MRDGKKVAHFGLARFAQGKMHVGLARFAQGNKAHVGAADLRKARKKSGLPDWSVENGNAGAI